MLYLNTMKFDESITNQRNYQSNIYKENDILYLSLSYEFDIKYHDEIVTYKLSIPKINLTNFAIEQVNSKEFFKLSNCDDFVGKINYHILETDTILKLGLDRNNEWSTFEINEISRNAITKSMTKEDIKKN